MNFVKRNAILLGIVVVLGGFMIYAWQTNFSFTKNLQNQGYVPGQAAPPPPAPPIPAPKVSYPEWRKSFEEERAK